VRLCLASPKVCIMIVRPMDNLSRTRLNGFTFPHIDRVSRRRTDDEWLSRQLTSPDARFLLVWRSGNLFSNAPTPAPVMLPPSEAAPYLARAESLTLLGANNGHPYFAVGLSDEDSTPLHELKKKGTFRNLRRLAPVLSEADGTLLAYARAMTYWHHTHRFCGTCGSSTVSSEAGFVRVCSNPDCGAPHFPRTDPAVIVLVTDSDRCILARKAEWPERMYSTLAGFVEPGETLEAAVVREVAEETSIVVNCASYHSSQPWPFPRSLMLGFTAQAEGGTIHIDEELESARWFGQEELAQALRSGRVRLPDALTIAHHLIEDWFNEGQIGPLSSYEIAE